MTASVSGTTAPISVAVIGLGSRGLGVLERIVTLAKRAGAAAGEVEVHLIDPAADGAAGVHRTDQPDYLLLNTTCSQVSMFPDIHTVGDDVDAVGPNLLDWATERGLRIEPDGYTVGTAGRSIGPTDFLPRRVLGEYLGFVLGAVVDRAPAQVRILRHCATAVDLSTTPSGGLLTTLDNGTVVATRYAFLTTGYTANTAQSSRPEHSRVITEPYPLPAALAEVAPGQSVALAGFGLSAIDVVSALTVGRGGSYRADGTRLVYQPSGAEPRLVLYSRTGLPCRARPLVTKWDRAHQPMAFTPTAIDALRSRHGGRLDFEADVMPLVLTEIRVAYRLCQAVAGVGSEADLVAALRAARGTEPAPDLPRLTAVLDELDATLGRFDAAAAFDGSSGMDLRDATTYQAWLMRVVEDDLVQGRLGFSASPIKAGLDVLRGLRDVFRYVVDFGGLTDASLEDFNARIVPMLNRAVVGPQFERHVELLALVDAGLLSAPLGPAPQVSWDEAAGRWRLRSTQLAVPQQVETDWLVSGFVDMPAVSTSADPLLSTMYAKGMIRPFRAVSRYLQGIDVDQHQHPLDAVGEPDARIWVLGPLCEGATFYNNLVPSPKMWSRPVADAHRCVAAMFSAAGVRITADGTAEAAIPGRA